MAGARELDELDVAVSGCERASVGDRSDWVGSSLQEQHRYSELRRVAHLVLVVQVDARPPADDALSCTHQWRGQRRPCGGRCQRTAPLENRAVEHHGIYPSSGRRVTQEVADDLTADAVADQDNA